MGKTSNKERICIQMGILKRSFCFPKEYLRYDISHKNYMAAAIGQGDDIQVYTKQE